MRPILRENNSIFADWFWKYVWLVPESYYKLSDLPHIALETEAMTADPLNMDERFYIDEVILMDEGNLYVHMDHPTRH